MKTLLTTFGFVFLANITFAQELNTYIDAKNLAILYQAKNESTNYFECQNFADQMEEISNKYVLNIEYFYSNPFLNDETKKALRRSCEPETESIYNEVTTDVPNKSTPLEIDLATTGGNKSFGAVSWQTAVLQGTADFMAERFKQELTNYALNQLLANFDENQRLILSDLFPNTVSFIDNYLKNADSLGFYYSDLNLLRYSAELDLRNFKKTVPDFVAKNSKKENIKSLMRISSSLALNPASYKDPIQVFNIFFTEVQNTDDANLKKQIKLAQIFMNAFRSDSSSDRIWINWSDINPTQIPDDLTVQFFYALLYEQTKGYFSDYENIVGDQTKDWVQKAIFLFENVDRVVKTIEDKESKERTFNDYKNLILTSAEVIDLFTHDSTKYRNTINSIFTIYESIEKKEYKFILPTIISMMNEHGLHHLYSDRQVFQNLNLFVNFTMVESPEDMKNLLETYALPIGSSSIKRTGNKNTWNISLNGYVGINFGYEKVYNTDTDGQYNFGLTAPIGFSFSHKCGNGWSGSIFLGIIDLGSLVNQNFKDEIATDSKLRVQQFLVPSLGYLVNIKNSPFSIGAIGSYHMDSRQFDDGIEVQNRLNSIRLNLTVLVDIPFFTIYNKN